MQTDSASPAPRSRNPPPPITRALRFVLAVGLLLVVITNVHTPAWKTALTIVATLMGLVFLYAAIDVLVASRLGHMSVLLGILVALAPGVLVFIGGNGDVRLGVFTFFALSLAVAAIAGDRGCEVTSVPALLLRRHTHLPCLVFAPLDKLEERLFWRSGRAA